MNSNVSFKPGANTPPKKQSHERKQQHEIEMRPIPSPNKPQKATPPPVSPWSSQSEDEPSMFFAAFAVRQTRAINNSKVFPPQAPWYILNPLSPWRPYWDLILLFALAYTAIITPYEVGFLSKRPPGVDTLFIFNTLINLIFLADLAMNLVLAQFDEDLGMWRITISSILRHYLVHWFIIDLISVIPFDLINLLANSPSLRRAVALRTIRLLRLMRLFRILKAMKLWRKWEYKVTVTYSTQSLIKFVVGALLLAHWMACMFRFVVDLENNSQGGSPYNWMIVAGLNPNDNLSCYIAAYYFAVMTMTTVGYGDISGHTNGERIVVIIMMLIGAGCFAYVIGAICGLINSLDAEGVSHRELMDSLHGFIRDNNLPKQLAENLRVYFLQSRHLRRQRSYEPLYDYMSPHLRAQTQYALFSYWIRDIPFFTSHWKGLPHREAREVKREYRSFVMKLATVLKQVAFGPHEEVIQKGQRANEMYLISNGKAARNGMLLGERKYFGHEMLMESYHHQYSVVTLTHMEGFVISREDLMSLIDSGRFPHQRKILRHWLLWFLIRYKLPEFALEYQRQLETIGALSETSTVSSSDELLGFSDVDQDRESKPTVPLLTDDHSAGANASDDKQKSGNPAEGDGVCDLASKASLSGRSLSSKLHMSGTSGRSTRGHSGRELPKSGSHKSALVSFMSRHAVSTQSLEQVQHRSHSGMKHMEHQMARLVRKLDEVTSRLSELESTSSRLLTRFSSSSSIASEHVQSVPETAQDSTASILPH